MKKHILILSVIILSAICHAQNDEYGLNVGVEIFLFDQAKVAKKYLPSFLPDHVIQVNYLPQINYTLPGKSEVGMYLGYGQRKIDNSIDATQSEEIKTITALAGLFYKYKFIKLDRIRVYCQSGLQIQLNHQRFKQLTTEYNEFETISVFQQEREIYALDVNLRIGSEYRLVRGLYINLFVGNDVISYNWVPEQVSTYMSSSALSQNETLHFIPDPLQSENYIYSTEAISRWVIFKNYIIFGGGLRYQF